VAKFVVIDGLDGSGKSTQFDMCKKKLERDHNTLELSFPTYDPDSSAALKLYLNGGITPTADGVNAYAAASFYAVDRYISFKRSWEASFRKAEFVLSCRYTTSNIIHQTPKLPKEERDRFINWLYDYEFVKLGLPKPDTVIFLDMPVEASQELLSRRYKGNETDKDIHERDIEYLRNCRKTALESAKKLDWTVIKCCERTDNGFEFLSEAEINAQIMELIK
jgi:dTMP kinase